MLSLKDVHSYYGASHILQGVNLEVKKGSAAVLLGRNGMGKTTAIHSIIGFVTKKEGEISFEGENVINLKSHQIARKGIGIVPQGRRIFTNLSVKENLTVFANQEQGGWDLEKVYKLFPRLKEREKSHAGNLSGGEQSMLSIGRALMRNPKILLLDEPTEGLSPLMVGEVMEVIVKLKEAGMSMLLVEQNIATALSIADDVYIINKGRIVYHDRPEELKKNMDIAYHHLAIS
ncbi:ABC transporter ATP-binding protein [Neobacillus rhizophilus]|uniref:ABC transporter ATP-binding protein n=1 Tax=Neobacillus rhizophilus TaxID=2833579 RepID=A0A942UBJ1_9BACI|nr:ABC transporter ATP-binding protein [Neobacillus rhizophilus]MBS4214329.1 ABC transporter ATP-binding protein [Neobacillus rhizophilus]MBU8915878.1 ABC transporter ATP-binding protein [Bacillus sp. FJAT-29953]